MTTAEAQAKTIDGRARTVRELLDKAKYAIDFYQREYAWQERQVRELIDDLTGKFLDSYKSSHSRHEVEGYGHYFLGSIVISHKRSQRFVVDGQQRLTTLTLLLIHLHHLQDDRDERVEELWCMNSQSHLETRPDHACGPLTEKGSADSSFLVSL